LPKILIFVVTFYNIPGRNQQTRDRKVKDRTTLGKNGTTAPETIRNYQKGCGKYGAGTGKTADDGNTRTEGRVDETE
jgi:hypothetical protein